MLDLGAIQEVANNLSTVNVSDYLNLSLGHFPVSWHVLAQQVKDPKVLDQMQNAFNYFIKSGQVWALGIGFFFGYWIRGITA